ncbi:MAG: ECF transporter S component [Thermofilaceae archaeon]
MARVQQGRRGRLLASTSILTAFTLLATILFTVYIPETKGYFNFGEVGVYISAIILPPAWAAFAGGVGSALADVVLGYYVYAPATLVIKGLEAFTASLLARRLKHVKMGRAQGLILTILVPAPLALLGAIYYVGPAEIYLVTSAVAAEVTAALWLVVAAIMAVFLLHLNLRGLARPQLAAALAAGGIVMVLGYFTYEQFILGFAALAEVPFNIMQVLVGMSVALAVEHRLRGLSFE